MSRRETKTIPRSVLAGRRKAGPKLPFEVLHVFPLRIWPTPLLEGLVAASGRQAKVDFEGVVASFLISILVLGAGHTLGERTSTIGSRSMFRS
jgi:hypothetical protein